MGFLDRVKEQAATASAVAKDAAQKGQAKLDEIQGKRAADAILRDLGAAFYAQETGRATAETQADMARLVAALRDQEKAHGPIDLQPDPWTKVQAPAPGPGGRPAPGSGGAGDGGPDDAGGGGGGA